MKTKIRKISKLLTATFMLWVFSVAYVSAQVPDQPSVITGDDEVCRGTTNNYSVTNVSGVTYTWTYSGTGFTVASGQGTNSITANFSSSATSGTLTVTPSNTDGNGSSRTKALTIIGVPDQPAAITGNSDVCQGDTETFSVTDVSGVDYDWTYSGSGFTVTSGQGTNSITAEFSSSATSGTLTVTPSNTCGNGSARTQAITILDIPDQPSAITGNLAPCTETTETYSVTDVSGVDYNWTYSGTGFTITSGQGTNSITAEFSSSATSGILTVTPSTSCGDGPVRADSIVINTVPEQPSLITGNTEPCIGDSEIYSVNLDTTVSYSWTFPADWVVTAGASEHAVTVTVGSDTGTVTVTPANVCGDGLSRDTIVVPVTCAGIDDLAAKTLKIYPNPVTDKLFLQFSNIDALEAHIYIFDVKGRQMASYFEKNIGNNHIINMDVQSLSPGIYNLKIIIGEKEHQIKFIK